MHKIDDLPRLVQRNGQTYTMNAARIGHDSSLEQKPQSEAITHLQQEQGNASFSPGWPHQEAAHLFPISWTSPFLAPEEERNHSSQGMQFTRENSTDSLWYAASKEGLEEDRSQREGALGCAEDVEDDHRREAFVQEKERRDTHVLRLLGSSESPEWYTPSEIVTLACELLGEIDLDPCSNSHDAPAVPARVRYTKEDNGLTHSWKGKTYLNPPYGSEIPLWVSKLIQSYEAGSVEEAIALLPGRIDTVWFQPLYAYLICHIQGRLQFANSPYHAPFPCVIVYLGTRTDAFINIFKCKGPILRRVG
jgi:hypothetical protein